MSLADRLRTDLARPSSSPPLESDLEEMLTEANVPAAVMVAVTDRPEPGVILTVRREDMRTHAGQVAFPGGRIDDGEDAVAPGRRSASTLPRRRSLARSILIAPSPDLSSRPCWRSLCRTRH
jgi:hypothetical protein